MREDKISPKDLIDTLEYNPSTGVLTWKYRVNGRKSWNTRWSGVQAFTANDNRGYKAGHVYGIKLSAHRVAWAIHYGEWPSGQIDHINCDSCDNRIENLRLATIGQNQRNKRRMATNTSGCKGVTWNTQHGKWRASIMFEGKYNYLGAFTDLDDAKRAYDIASLRLHGEFSNAG